MGRIDVIRYRGTAAVTPVISALVVIRRLDTRGATKGKPSHAIHQLDPVYSSANHRTSNMPFRHASGYLPANVDQ